MKKIFLVALLTLIAAGCSDRENLSPIPTIDEQTKKQIDKPVNCQTAKRDIKVLAEEKASVGKQLLSGVRAVMPIAAVSGILMGDYSDRVEVATGQYNSDIEHKISQIQRTCGIRTSKVN